MVHFARCTYTRIISFKLNSFAKYVDEGALLIPIADVVVSVFVLANPASQPKEICVVANMNADAMFLAPIASVKGLAFSALVVKSPKKTISALNILNTIFPIFHVHNGSHISLTIKILT